MLVLFIWKHWRYGRPPLSQILIWILGFLLKIVLYSGTTRSRLFLQILPIESSLRRVAQGLLGSLGTYLERVHFDDRVVEVVLSSAATLSEKPVNLILRKRLCLSEEVRASVWVGHLRKNALELHKCIVALNPQSPGAVGGD